MTIAADIIDQASVQLHGYGSNYDRITPLAADIGPTDTTFQVAYAYGQAVGITPGMVEIDDELLYVVTVDPTNGTCTVAYRGYRGTTPATHIAGTSVISRPKFPRTWLFDQMNNVIGQVYPDLFQVLTYQTTIQWPRNTYTIPGIKPLRIIDCQWQNPLGDWEGINGYKIDPYDQTVRIGSGGMVGRPIRFLYAAPPGKFTLQSDDFVVATGLPDTTQDVLMYGIVARAVGTLDIARAQTTSVEQSDRSRIVPPFAGQNAAKFYEAKFQDRLKNEAAALRKLYRSRLVRTW